MTKVIIPTAKLRHILLWLIATLYLLFSPSFYYRWFPQEGNLQEGKPLEVLKQQPERTGGIRYNVEDCKYWSTHREGDAEGETYALWGWAFLNIGPNILQADFERFVIIYSTENAYVFPMEIYERPDVQRASNDLGLTDLSSSGFYSLISRNALAIGEYGIGLLFKDKQNGTSHYVQTNKILVRSPNRLLLASGSK